MVVGVQNLFTALLFFLSGLYSSDLHATGLTGLQLLGPELLHILGLEEVKEKSQKFIVRKAKDKRDNGSIIENTINELDSKDKIYRLANANQYGNTHEERLFTVTLDLSIIMDK